MHVRPSNESSLYSILIDTWQVPMFGLSVLPEHDAGKFDGTKPNVELQEIAYDGGGDHTTSQQQFCRQLTSLFLRRTLRKDIGLVLVPVNDQTQYAREQSVQKVRII